MTILPDRQQRILSFIITFKTAFDGLSPTRRQIGAACNITSTSVVQYHLGILERHGYITLGEGSRSIRVTGGAWAYKAPEMEMA